MEFDELRKHSGIVRWEKHLIETNPEWIVEAFYQLKIVVMRAEMMWNYERMEYVVLSPFLPEQTEAEALKMYAVEDRVDNGKHYYSFREW